MDPDPSSHDSLSFKGEFIMGLSQRNELTDALEEALRNILTDRDVLNKLIGDSVVSIVHKDIDARITEHNRIKWDRAFGVNCTDFDSIQALRHRMDWINEQYMYAHSPEGKIVIENLKAISKIEDIGILKDVAKIATDTKQKLYRAFVIVLLALFFAAGGWSLHDAGLKLLPDKFH